MVPPSCLSQGSTAHTAQPTQPSERRVTRKSNATAHPGLPDKPATKRTSEQKRCDEETVKRLKEARKQVQDDAYQRISTMQAQMVRDQSEAQKDRVGMRPKPRIVQKKEAGKEEANMKQVILPPRYPCQSSFSHSHVFHSLFTVRRVRLPRLHRAARQP